MSTLSFETSLRPLWKLFLLLLSIGPGVQAVPDYLQHFLEFEDHLRLWKTFSNKIWTAGLDVDRKLRHAQIASALWRQSKLTCVFLTEVIYINHKTIKHITVQCPQNLHH